MFLTCELERRASGARVIRCSGASQVRDGGRRVHEGEKNLVIVKVVVDREVGRISAGAAGHSALHHIQIPAGACPVGVAGSV